jgi:hypothetical protein
MTGNMDYDKKEMDRKPSLLYSCFCKALEKGRDVYHHGDNWQFAKRSRLDIYSDRIECGSWTIKRADIEDVSITRIRQWGILPGYIVEVKTSGKTYLLSCNPWARPAQYLGVNTSGEKRAAGRFLFWAIPGVILLICVGAFILSDNGLMHKLLDDISDVVADIRDTRRKQGVDKIKGKLFSAGGNRTSAHSPVAITDIDGLKSFIANGKKRGYFPTHVVSSDPTGPDKLQEINIDFRTVIDWKGDARCPDHTDQVILARFPENQSVECGFGDTAVLLGTGNDWVDDAWGNDIIVPGKGDDTIDAGSGSDIIIFEKGWGHDSINIHSEKVDTNKLIGYRGEYPWKFSSFIIFAYGIERDHIVWKEGQLVNIKTGDSIAINTQNINILFAEDPTGSAMDFSYVATSKEPEPVRLEDINAESVFIQGNTAYYANGNEGLYVLDLKRIDHPLLLSKTVLPGRAMAVQLNGDIAYVAQGDRWLEDKRGWVSILDMTNLQNPQIIKTLSFGSSVYDIAIGDDLLFVPETSLPKRESTLHIFDIETPKSAKRLSRTPLEQFTQYVALLDKTLYLSRRLNGIQLFDVKNPKKPQKVNEYKVGKHTARSIKTHENKVVINQTDNHFTVLGVVPGNRLSLFCRVKTPESKHYQDAAGVDSIWLRDNYVFRGEGENGVSVTDISDPENCRVLDSIAMDIEWASTIYIINNNLVAFTDRKGAAYADLNEMFPEYTADREPEEEIASEIERPKKKVHYSQDQLQKLLYEAATDDDAEDVRELCQQGAKPDLQGHLPHSPIALSAMTGRTKALRALLECPGRPTAKAMITAALQERFEAMKILEEYGGDIGQTDEDGCTTLHYLAQDGTLEMIQYLVKKGVPVHATCRGGETALKWAHYGKNTPVIEYLESL